MDNIFIQTRFRFSDSMGDIGNAMAKRYGDDPFLMKMSVVKSDYLTKMLHQSIEYLSTTLESARNQDIMVYGRHAPDDNEYDWGIKIWIGSGWDRDGDSNVDPIVAMQNMLFLNKYVHNLLVSGNFEYGSSFYICASRNEHRLFIWDPMDPKYSARAIPNTDVCISKYKIFDGILCDLCGQPVEKNKLREHKRGWNCAMETSTLQAQNNNLIRLDNTEAAKIVRSIQNIQTMLVPERFSLYVPQWVIDAINMYDNMCDKEGGFAGMTLAEYLLKMGDIK